MLLPLGVPAWSCTFAMLGEIRTAVVSQQGVTEFPSPLQRTLLLPVFHLCAAESQVHCLPFSELSEARTYTGCLIPREPFFYKHLSLLPLASAGCLRLSASAFPCPSFLLVPLQSLAQVGQLRGWRCFNSLNACTKPLVPSTALHKWGMVVYICNPRT